MQCFNHNDRSAVGHCKVCGKGLCVECAADLGHSLACKDTHETMAHNINIVLKKNIDAI